jgi:hypothetical protein
VSLCLPLAILMPRRFSVSAAARVERCAVSAMASFGGASGSVLLDQRITGSDESDIDMRVRRVFAHRRIERHNPSRHQSGGSILMFG